MSKILVVDDERDICEILCFNLEAEGHTVKMAESAEEAMQFMQDEVPDLILLDVMMEGISGFQMARMLKEDTRTANIPIIFCTAKNTENDTLTGFSLGSDDYITKPFRLNEVKARVKAVLRRTAEKAAAAAQTSGEGAATDDKNCPIVFDEERKECLIEGQPITLTKIEYKLLKLLVSNPGRVYSREQLLDRVWPNDTVVLDRTVDVNITRIRKKIGDLGQCIRTKFGYGYCFELR